MLIGSLTKSLYKYYTQLEHGLIMWMDFKRSVYICHNPFITLY